MKVLSTECWGTILERSSVKCVKPPLFPSDKTSKNVDEEMNYFFYTNSNKYSDFINDPISGENMKSSSINRRELKGRMKVVCQ